jgi:hypothetical protein
MGKRRARPGRKEKKTKRRQRESIALSPESVNEEESLYSIRRASLGLALDWNADCVN